MAISCLTFQSKYCKPFAYFAYIFQMQDLGEYEKSDFKSFNTISAIALGFVKHFVTIFQNSKYIA